MDDKRPVVPTTREAIERLAEKAWADYYDDKDDQGHDEYLLGVARGLDQALRAPGVSPSTDTPPGGYDIRFRDDAGRERIIMPPERGVPTDPPEEERRGVSPTTDAPPEPWSPTVNQDALCECGHPYYRHFDPYDDNRAVGCKYCSCFTFTERGVPTSEPTDAHLYALVEAAIKKYHVDLSARSKAENHLYVPSLEDVSRVAVDAVVAALRVGTTREATDLRTQVEALQERAVDESKWSNEGQRIGWYEACEAMLALLGVPTDPPEEESPTVGEKRGYTRDDLIEWLRAWFHRRNQGAFARHVTRSLLAEVREIDQASTEEERRGGDDKP